MGIERYSPNVLISLEDDEEVIDFDYDSGETTSSNESFEEVVLVAGAIAGIAAGLVLLWKLYNWIVKINSRVQQSSDDLRSKIDSAEKTEDSVSDVDRELSDSGEYLPPAPNLYSRADIKAESTGEHIGKPRDWGSLSKADKSTVWGHSSDNSWNSSGGSSGSNNSWGHSNNSGSSSSGGGSSSGGASTTRNNPRAPKSGREIKKEALLLAWAEIQPKRPTHHTRLGMAIANNDAWVGVLKASMVVSGEIYKSTRQMVSEVETLIRTLLAADPSKDGEITSNIDHAINALNKEIDAHNSIMSAACRKVSKVPTGVMSNEPVAFLKAYVGVLNKICGELNTPATGQGNDMDSTIEAAKHASRIGKSLEPLLENYYKDGLEANKVTAQLKKLEGMLKVPKNHPMAKSQSMARLRVLVRTVGNMSTASAGIATFTIKVNHAIGNLVQLRKEYYDYYVKVCTMCSKTGP